MVDVITDDRPDIVLINGGRAVHKVCKVVLILLITLDDIGLIVQGNLGVRDNEGGQECMSFTADTTADAADTDRDREMEDFKGANVISMDREAGRVPTGTFELEELKIRDKVIIKILDIYSSGIAIEFK